MSDTVLLDGHHIPVHCLDKTWVEYDNDIYFVYYDVRQLTLGKKQGQDSIEIPIPTEISFKSVKPEVYNETVVYTGDDVPKPTVMRIVKYISIHKYSYHLKDENGEYICATPYEIQPINF